MMKKPIVIVLLVGLMFTEGLLIMVATQLASASGDWWDTNWTKRRQITVGNHPENYQIKVEIPSGIGRDNYGSIRFLEDETSDLLPYWIERNEGSYLDVAWVRRLKEGTTADSTIWMYYCNTDASSAENGDNTFLFFDDFGGGNGGSDALNHNKWWHSDYSIDVYQYVMLLKVWNGNEGKIEHGESKGLTTEEENTRRVIETRMKNTRTYRGGLLLTGPGWDHTETACIFEKGGGEYRFWANNFPGTSDGGYLSEQNHPGDVWYVLSVDLYGDSKDKAKSHFYWGNDNADYRGLVEESQELTHDWAPPDDRVNAYALRVWDDSSEYYFDWFIVRKYASPEPSVEVGPEQSLPGKPLLYSPPDGTTTFDDTPTFEWTKGKDSTNNRLLVDNDPDFSSPEENFLWYENFYTPTTPLSPDNYSWKVIAINAYGEMESSVWTFVIEKCGVEVTIENKFQENTPCTWVTFNVIVHNTGTIVDNYHLRALDGLWPPENIILDPENLENVPPSESRVAKLHVHIPSGATPDENKEIIVIAESMTCHVTDNDNAIVHVLAPLGAQIYLENGWNLVGFTAVGAGDTPSNLFPSLTYLDNYRLIRWQAPGGPYATQPEMGLLKDNTGYWVWIDRNYTVTTSGTRPASRTENMKAGWNLVCFPVDNASTTPHNVFPGLTYLDNYRLIYWRAPGGPYVTQPEMGLLKDNTGYWVWIDENFTITVPA